MRTPTLGDIGEEVEQIELEPLEIPAPVQIPVPIPA